MGARRSRSGSRLRGESGSELIEMALTLPLILLVVLAIVDFGFLFQQYEIVQNSARAGARFGANPDVSDTEIEDRVKDYVQEAGLSTTALNPVVTVTNATLSAAGGSWQAKQVDVAYLHDYTVMVPFAAWFGGSFSGTTLTSRATMRTEAAVTGLP